MPERPSENFERHPDVRTLQGVDGGPHLHEIVQGKLDLFIDAPVLARVADVPVNHSLTINSLSASGEEESVTFRRYPDREEATDQQHWVLVRKEGDEYIEEPVALGGSCATAWGTLGETDDIRVRQYAYFCYAVTYRLRFRHGSEVPGTWYNDYDVPEVQVDPSVLEGYLALAHENSSVFRGEDGLLYYNLIDSDKSYSKITGQVISVAVEPVEQTQQ